MKIGFLISHFGPNQLAFHFIMNTNRYLNNRQGVDVIAFISNQVRPNKVPRFAIMNTNEAFDFDGAVVATNLHAAEKITHFPGPSKRYFYVWDLEWMRQPVGFTFEKMQEIYCNPKLKLIARHREHADVIAQCWNKSVHAVIPNCEVEEFVKLVTKDDKK